MICAGCQRDLPRAQFTVPGRGSYSRRCPDCRKKKAQTPAPPPPPKAQEPGTFKVGYGPQLFPRSVKLVGLAPVDRERALWVGQLYNANVRRDHSP